MTDGGIIGFGWTLLILLGFTIIWFVVLHVLPRLFRRKDGMYKIGWKKHPDQVSDPTLRGGVGIVVAADEMDNGTMRLVIQSAYGEEIKEYPAGTLKTKRIGSSHTHWFSVECAGLFVPEMDGLLTKLQMAEDDADDWKDRFQELNSGYNAQLEIFNKFLSAQGMAKMQPMQQRTRP